MGLPLRRTTRPLEKPLLWKPSRQSVLAVLPDQGLLHIDTATTVLSTSLVSGRTIALHPLVVLMEPEVTGVLLQTGRASSISSQRLEKLDLD